MMWFIAPLFAQLSFAAPCDVNALAESLREVSPIGVGRAFVNLADCDTERAESMMAEHFTRGLPGEHANKAMAIVLELGGEEYVSTWLRGLESSDRSRTVSWLGSQCKDHPSVPPFFLKMHSTMGAEFWEQRWHRGLSNCRDVQIQGMLKAALDDPETGVNARNRTGFFAILEVYARNVGEPAIPVLSDLTTQLDDPKEVAAVVSIFADTANVGSLQGVNESTAQKAVEQLIKIGPSLPPDSINQARDTLLALNAADHARAFVEYRWPDRLLENQYTYLVVAKELATCKNGKQQGVFHFGKIQMQPKLWPDEIKSTLTGPLTEKWKLTLADKCKGTGELLIDMYHEPLSEDISRKTKEWLEVQRGAFRAQVEGYSKQSQSEEDMTSL